MEAVALRRNVQQNFVDVVRWLAQSKSGHIIELLVAVEPVEQVVGHEILAY